MELEEKGLRTNARRIQRGRVPSVVCGLMLGFGILASNQALSNESVPSETPEAQQKFIRILSPEDKDVYEEGETCTMAPVPEPLAMSGDTSLFGIVKRDCEKPVAEVNKDVHSLFLLLSFSFCIASACDYLRLS